MHTAPNKSRNELLIGSILLLALVLTRSGITRSHFGTEFNLPDASWAVFWLMGALTAKRIWPLLLLMACVAVDYFVIAGGVSAYCFTPAYPFLIPAYFSLWAFGKWSQSQLPVHARSLPMLALSVVAGVSTCFAISNVGFYLASGYFAQMPFSLYVQTVTRYWSYNMLHTGVFAMAGLVVHYIARHLQRRATPPVGVSAEH